MLLLVTSLFVSPDYRDLRAFEFVNIHYLSSIAALALKLAHCIIWYFQALVYFSLCRIVLESPSLFLIPRSFLLTSLSWFSTWVLPGSCYEIITTFFCCLAALWFIVCMEWVMFFWYKFDFFLQNLQWFPSNPPLYHSIALTITTFKYLKIYRKLEEIAVCYTYAFVCLQCYLKDRIFLSHENFIPAHNVFWSYSSYSS